MKKLYLINNVGLFWFKYLLFILLVSMITENILLTFASLAVLPLVLHLVYRQNEPPIFPFIIFFHWIQISVKIFHADLLNVSIDTISMFDSTSLAIYLSLFGLFALSFTIYIVTSKISITNKSMLERAVKDLSLPKVLLIYFFALIISLLLVSVKSIIPSLGAIIHTFLGLKSIFLYVLFLVLLVNKNYKLLFILLLLETAIGFSGFFSSFKSVYIIFFIAYFTLNSKIEFKRILMVSPIIILILTLTIVWTAIKPEYRSTVSDGRTNQSVNIDTSTQLNLYYNLLSNLDEEKLTVALEAFAYRLEYIEFFAQTINTVPSNVDYEYGKLWFTAYTNIFQPRFLFPNKPKLDDSIRTNKYTGLRFAGIDEGLSVSLGYFAESYIDFGYFMFILLFILGAFYSYIYKYFMTTTKYKVLAYGILVYILYNHYLFETRNDKVVGGIMISLIIILITKKIFLIPLYKYMRISNKSYQNRKGI